MVERLKINQFYGAPTAIRLLIKYGDQWVKKYDRSTLKTLGSGMWNMIFWKKKKKHFFDSRSSFANYAAEFFQKFSECNMSCEDFISKVQPGLQ